ncbi:MAG: sulfite exporter TauE/SafE family protein [Bacteroidales bacterium]|jgi:uncharacterized membrane protein YfcA|nr:sulfite exporter TauE/SafE family protein [Bacteroidales bacterium]
MTAELVIIFIVSGIVVGFINTLAGGGTLISMSLFLMLGLPPAVANGTNRIAVVLQNLVSVLNFRQEKLLNLRKSVCCTVPVALGSLLGSNLSIIINEKAFTVFFVIIMSIMLLLMFIKPNKWLIGNPDRMQKPISVLQWILYFLIGIYAGFIHIGMGYFLLAVLVLMNGYDLRHANAVKSFIVLFYTPVSLIAFMYHGFVNYEYGLTHAVGNMIGAYIASKWAINWGTNFIRWVVAVFCIVSCLYVLDILDLEAIFHALFHKEK